jgi:hypothetical protein
MRTRDGVSGVRRFKVGHAIQIQPDELRIKNARGVDPGGLSGNAGVSSGARGNGPAARARHAIHDGNI